MYVSGLSKSLLGLLRFLLGLLKSLLGLLRWLMITMIEWDNNNNYDNTIKKDDN